MTIHFDHDGEYYRTTLEENALDYLVKTCEFYDKTGTDASYWKWTIIALHGCLYHFMLAALVRSDQSGIYYVDIRDDRGLIDFSKKLRLIDFLKAYEWVKDPIKMKKYIHSQPLISTINNDSAMAELNDIFRNQFIHYMPLSWSIEIQKMKEVIKNVLPILQFLISDSGNILWHNNTPQDARGVLDKISTSLETRI